MRDLPSITSACCSTLHGLGFGDGNLRGQLAAGFFAVLICVAYARFHLRRKRGHVERCDVALPPPLSVPSVRQTRRDRAALQDRVQAVERAARSVSERDARLAPAVVQQEAEWLFRRILELSIADEREALADLIDPELMQKWRPRLVELSVKRWHASSMILGDVNVQYIGLENATGSDTRVLVRITARVRVAVEDSHGRVVSRRHGVSNSRVLRLDWTLTERGRRWILTSVAPANSARVSTEGR